VSRAIRALRHISFERSELGATLSQVEKAFLSILTCDLRGHWRFPRHNSCTVVNALSIDTLQAAMKEVGGIDKAPEKSDCERSEEHFPEIRPAGRRGH